MRIAALTLFVVALGGCQGPASVHPGAEGARCGRSGDARCADGLYCQHKVVPAGEHADPAVCRARPTICPEIYQPICGEDGNVYSNACKAAAAGVNQAFVTACPGMMREAPPTPPRGG